MVSLPTNDLWNERTPIFAFDTNYRRPQNFMTRRQIIVIVALAMIALAIVIFRWMAASNAAPLLGNTSEIRRTVKVSWYEPKLHQLKTEFTGRLSAVNHVDLTAEVTAVLLAGNKPFKTGQRFNKGELLLKMDDREQRFSLLAQKSEFQNLLAQMLPDFQLDYEESYPQWKQYFDDLNIQDELPVLPNPSSEKERLFVSGKNIYSLFYQIKSTESRLAKYEIRAPYSGVVTSSLVDAGGLIRAGTPVGSFVGTENFEVETTIPHAFLQDLDGGSQVHIQSEGNFKIFEARLARTGSMVDPNTQMVAAFLSISGKNLLEGQFVRGELKTETQRESTAIPRNLLLEGNRVFVVRDSILHFQQIRIEHVYADSVYVQGLGEGEWLVDQKLDNAAEGIRVNPIISEVE